MKFAMKQRKQKKTGDILRPLFGCLLIAPLCRHLLQAPTNQNGNHNPEGVVERGGRHLIRAQNRETIYKPPRHAMMSTSYLKKRNSSRVGKCTPLRPRLGSSHVGNGDDE